MKKSIFLILAVILIIPEAFTQKTVIGTVDYTYKLEGEGAEQMAAMMPEKMVAKYGENGIAIEIQGGVMNNGLGKTVVNGKTGEAFIINDIEKTVYLMSAETIKTEAAKIDDAEIEELEETKEIMGYTCHKYVQTTTVQNMTMSQVLWVTRDLKTLDYEGEAFKGMAGQSSIGFQVDGFPLLIEIDMPGMPTSLNIAVSNISYEDIPDSTFDRPEGYAVKDFSELRRF